MPRKPSVTTTGSFLLVLALGLAGGIAADRSIPGLKAQPASKDLSLISSATDIIQKNYVEAATIQPKQLTYGALSGMLDSLGDTGHTRFLSPEDVSAENDSEQGQFAGIGVEVQYKAGHVVIVEPLPDSPALAAGLHSGEIILQVDGVDITGQTLEEARSRIAGAAGTKVSLVVFDPVAGTSNTFDLVRKQISISSVSWAQVPGTKIADLRISSFSKGTTDDLKKALEAIRAQGLQATVLDLRNNPGGLLDESIGTASLFLSSGDVLLEKDAQGTITHTVVKPGVVDPDHPLVLLVNSYTASASEVVAGALQDSKRARVFGTVTYGTGTVLSRYSLADGSAMLLATREWLTPSGRTIFQKGIQPDVPVALKSLDVTVFPRILKTMDAASFRQAGDSQLLAAVDALTGELPK